MAITRGWGGGGGALCLPTVFPNHRLPPLCNHSNNAAVDRTRCPSRVVVTAGSKMSSQSWPRTVHNRLLLADNQCRAAHACRTRGPRPLPMTSIITSETACTPSLLPHWTNTLLWSHGWDDKGWMGPQILRLAHRGLPQTISCQWPTATEGNRRWLSCVGCCPRALLGLLCFC